MAEVVSLSLSPVVVKADAEAQAQDVNEMSAEPVQLNDTAAQPQTKKRARKSASGEEGSHSTKRKRNKAGIDYKDLIAQAILSNMGHETTGQFICHWISMHYPTLTVCGRLHPLRRNTGRREWLP
jgi:hypothetical protein